MACHNLPGHREASWNLRSNWGGQSSEQPGDLLQHLGRPTGQSLLPSETAASPSSHQDTHGVPYFKNNKQVLRCLMLRAPKALPQWQRSPSTSSDQQVLTGEASPGTL